MNDNINNLIVAGEGYRAEFQRSLEKSFIEKVGTGIGRIKQAVEKHGGCTVKINYDTFYTITFLANLISKTKKTTKTRPIAEAPVEVPVEVPVELSLIQNKIVIILTKTPCGRSQLLHKLGYSKRTGNFSKALEDLINKELIAMTRPDKPNSRFQKYRLTEKGQQLVENEAIRSKKDSFQGENPKNSGAMSEKTVGETVGETVVQTVGETVGEILLAIKGNPKITRKELRQLTGLSIRGVEWNLAKLKEKGVIERIGPTKGGHWKIIQTPKKGSE